MAGTWIPDSAISGTGGNNGAWLPDSSFKAAPQQTAKPTATPAPKQVVTKPQTNPLASIFNAGNSFIGGLINDSKQLLNSQPVKQAENTFNSATSAFYKTILSGGSGSLVHAVTSFPLIQAAGQQIGFNNVTNGIGGTTVATKGRKNIIDQIFNQGTDKAIGAVQSGIENAAAKQDTGQAGIGDNIVGDTGKALSWVQQNVVTPVFEQQTKNPVLQPLQSELRGFQRTLASTLFGNSDKVQQVFNKSIDNPKDWQDKAAYTIGDLAGGAAAYYLGGKALPSAVLGKAAMPALFALLGQTSDSNKTTVLQRIEQAPVDAFAGYMFGGLSGNPVAAAGKAAGIMGVNGFIDSIIKGMSGTDAVKAGGALAAISGLFHIAAVSSGMIGDKLTQSSIKTGTVEMTPQEVQHQVMNTDLRGTPTGDALMKASLDAQRQGANVKITGSAAKQSTVANALNLSTPQGIRIDKIEFTKPQEQVAGQEATTRQEDTVQNNPNVQEGEVVQQPSDTENPATTSTQTQSMPDVVKQEIDNPNRNTAQPEKAPTVRVPAEFKSDIEKQAFEKISKDPVSVRDEYLAKFGNEVNPDLALQLFEGYKGHNSGELSRASGAVKSLVYDHLLETEQGKKNNTVVINAGGSGSGKTSAVNADAKLKEDNSIVLDTTYSHNSAFKDVKKALDNGYRVHFNFVLRDPNEAWSNGVLPRTKSEGRVISEGYFLRSHVDAVRNFLETYKKYKDNPDVGFTVYENTPEGRKEVPVDTLTNKTYNKAELAEHIKSATESHYEQGEITKEQYTATTSDRAELEKYAAQLERSSAETQETKASSLTDETLLNDVRDAFYQGDEEAAKAIYEAHQEAGAKLPELEAIRSEVEKVREDTLSGVKQEQKELGESSDAQNPDSPDAQLREIARLLSDHFSRPGAKWKITGKERTYRSMDGRHSLQVGGNASIAFDRLYHSVDIEGFKKNITVLKDTFPNTSVFTTIYAKIRKGDIDGANYEDFQRYIDSIQGDRLASKTTKASSSQANKQHLLDKTSGESVQHSTNRDTQTTENSSKPNSSNEGNTAKESTNAKDTSTDNQREASVSELERGREQSTDRAARNGQSVKTGLTQLAQQSNSPEDFVKAYNDKLKNFDVFNEKNWSGLAANPVTEEAKLHRDFMELSQSRDIQAKYKADPNYNDNQALVDIYHKVKSNASQAGLSDTVNIPLRPESIEKSSANPIAPAGSRWEADRGAIPGEPMMYLDGFGNKAKAALIERVDDQGNALYEAVDNKGQSLGVFPDVATAAKSAEQRTASHVAQQPQGNTDLLGNEITTKAPKTEQADLGIGSGKLSPEEQARYWQTMRNEKNTASGTNSLAGTPLGDEINKQNHGGGLFNDDIGEPEGNQPDRSTVQLNAGVDPGLKQFFEGDIKPAYNTGKSIVKEWQNVINPSLSNEQAKKAANAIRKAKARIRNYQALTNQQFKGFRKFYSKYSDVQNVQNISSYERTGYFAAEPKLTAKQRNQFGVASYSDLYRESMKSSYDVLLAAYGKDAESFIENYVRRQFIFDSEADEARGKTFLTNYMRTLSANKSPLKHRVLDMPLEEALEDMKARDIKVRMATTNPEELRQWSLVNAQRAMAYKEAWDDAKQSKLVVFVRNGDKIPEGMVRLQDRAAEVFAPAEIRFGDSEDGYNMAVSMGRYYADPAVARVFNNAISTGLEQFATYKGARAVSNTMNQFQLGLSGFHFAAVGLDAGVTDLSIGMAHVLQGHPLTGAKHIAFGSVPFLSFFKDMYHGKQIINGLLEGDPRMEKFVTEQLNRAGGNIGLSREFQNHAWEAIQHAINNNNPIGVLGRVGFYLPSALIQSVGHPLLGYAIPRVKLGAFMDLAALKLSRLGPNASDFEIDQALKSTYQSIDNRMGQLEYDNLFWNKVLKNIMMLVTRAVGWDYGTIGELGGAVTDAFKLGAEDYNTTKIIGNKGISDRLMWGAGLVMLVAMYSAIYQYIHTGHGPNELKDYFHPKNGLTDKNGNPDRVNFASYLKDVFAYSSNPIQTSINKSSPLLDIMSSLIGNKDYYGNLVRNPNDPTGMQLSQTGAYLLRTIFPFTVQQTINQIQEGANPERVAEGFLGIVKAPQSVIQSDQYKAAQKALQNQLGLPGPKTPEQIQIQNLKTQARTQINHGGWQKSAAFQQLIKNGTLNTQRKRTAFIKSAYQSSLQRATAHLPKATRQQILNQAGQ